MEQNLSENHVFQNPRKRARVYSDHTDTGNRQMAVKLCGVFACPGNTPLPSSVAVLKVVGGPPSQGGTSFGGQQGTPHFQRAVFCYLGAAFVCSNGELGVRSGGYSLKT